MTMTDEERLSHRVMATRMLYPIHPIANLLPEASDLEIKAMMASIKRDGQLQPAYLYEGMVLDGRVRAIACHRLRQTLMVVEFLSEVDGNPIHFVMQRNLGRHKLSLSQRALVGEKIFVMLQQDDQLSSGIEDLRTDRWRSAKRNQAGMLVGIGSQLVGAVRTIKKWAPDLYDRVVSGEMTVSQAASYRRQRDGSTATTRGNPWRSKRLPPITRGREPKNFTPISEPKQDPSAQALREAIDELRVWRKSFRRYFDQPLFQERLGKVIEAITEMK